MCYSAMIEQDAKNLARLFDARIQIQDYGQLFKQRLEGEKLYINKGMEVPFLDRPKTMEERSIGRMIREWHDKEIERLKQELEKQEQRLKKAEISLKEKETKKAREDQRIATNKISKCKYDLEKHKPEKLTTTRDSDYRIFPFHYASMLYLNEKGDVAVGPFRYLMRPSNKDASFDRQYSGCYNARLDSLNQVPWWKSSLGKRHGVMMVKKFYENVSAKDYAKKFKIPAEKKKEENLELCFSPENVDWMFVPTLWDQWSSQGHSPLKSTALITDEPLPDIQATGHDRTPIFLKESAVLDWLRATGQSTQELKAVLDKREHPRYSHSISGVA